MYISFSKNKSQTNLFSDTFVIKKLQIQVIYIITCFA